MKYTPPNIVSKTHSVRIDSTDMVYIVSKDRYIDKVVSKYKERYYVINNTRSTFGQNIFPSFSFYMNTMEKEFEKMKAFDKLYTQEGWSVRGVHSGQLYYNHECYSLEGLPALILL